MRQVSFSKFQIFQQRKKILMRFFCVNMLLRQSQSSCDKIRTGAFTRVTLSLVRNHTEDNWADVADNAAGSRLCAHPQQRQSHHPIQCFGGEACCTWLKDLRFRLRLTSRRWDDLYTRPGTWSISVSVQSFYAFVSYSATKRRDC